MRNSTRSTRSPSYLFQSQYAYNFRLSVPSDLRQIVGRTEFRLSLKTGNLPEARRKSRLLAGLIQGYFSQIRVNRSAYGRADVEARIQEFLGFVLGDSGDLPRSSQGPAVFTQEPGIRLKVLVERYKTENQRASNWSERTARDYSTCLDLFLRFFGNVSISSIGYREMRSYKRLLLLIPANYTKFPGYDELSLKEICNSGKGNKLSVRLSINTSG